MYQNYNIIAVNHAVLMKEKATCEKWLAKTEICQEDEEIIKRICGVLIDEWRKYSCEKSVTIYYHAQCGMVAKMTLLAQVYLDFT